MQRVKRCRSVRNLGANYKKKTKRRNHLRNSTHNFKQSFIEKKDFMNHDNMVDFSSIYLKKNNGTSFTTNSHTGEREQSSSRLENFRYRDMLEEEEAYGAPLLSAEELGMDKETYDLLVALQIREITPEDYEVLTALDETVEKGGIDQQKIDLFPKATIKKTETQIVAVDLRWNTVHKLEANSCLICQEDFENGSIVRRITCGHIFHVRIKS
eukprot:UC4_evm6s127